MKKILTVLLSIAMLLAMVASMLPVTVFADVGKFTDPKIEYIDVTDPANLGRAVTDGNGHYVDTFAYAAKHQGYIWLEKITLDSAIAWSTEGSTDFPADTVDKVEGTRYVNKKWLSYESDSHTLGEYDGEYAWVTLESVKLYDIKNQCYVEPTKSAWLTLNDTLSSGEVVPVGMYAQEYIYDVWTDLYLEAYVPMWVGFPSDGDMTVTMDGQTLKPRSEASTESLGSHTPGMYWVGGGYTAGSSSRTTYPCIARGLHVNSPVHYVYDVKPVINSVTVNGQGGAYNNNYVANNGTVTIATNYDSKLSDALTAYGCSVKQLSAHYLNGEKITVAAPIPVDNGDGTSTKTYNRTLNPGDELRVESWLEVRWPDGHTDRVDENTVTVSGPSRQFITQPHYVGDGMQAGENYVAWKLNFTPIKLIARYNLGTAARPNWKEVELDATKSRASLPAISQNYTLYAFYGTGARDYVASDAFSATDPVEFTPAFTLQPSNGVSLGGAYSETTWATNFTPVTLALVKINYAPNGRPLYTYEELDVNATYCTVQPGFDEYCIYAYYNDTQYVASNKFIVTEMNYYNAWFYVDDTVLDKVMVLEGDYVERPADPVKDGYQFIGWYTDDGEAYNFAAPVTDDVHLTARFEENEPEYIDTIHIEGLSAPQYGQTVNQWYDALYENWGTGTLKYSNADKVRDDGWDILDSNGDVLYSTSTDTITEGTYYWYICFKAETGYALADDLVVTVAGVDNANVEVVYDGNGWYAVFVKYEVTNPAEPPVGAIPGDVNEDGKVNIRDLGLVQQSLNGWNVTLNTDAADVNGDGKINIRDLGLIQQYLNGWNVELK